MTWRGRGATPHSRDSMRPSFANSSALKTEGAGDPQQRAQGRPGARCTRDLVRKDSEKSAHEHTGSAEAVRPSLRNGFTAYFVLSLATGFFVTIIPKKLASQELDASIGASGPHDFAVRLTRCSSKALWRPPHPIPTFVTMANAPPPGPDGWGHEGDLHERKREKILKKDRKSVV